VDEGAQVSEGWLYGVRAAGDGCAQ
jgi:hypothetical protein